MATHLPERYAGLPDADLIDQGLTDLAAGREDTVPALLVLIGAPRLRAAGIDVPKTNIHYPDGELYLLLAKEHDNTAHDVFNALVRRLVAFTHATDWL